MGSAEDAEARFERLFRDFHPSVLRYALRRADAAVADDAVGEVFLIAWRRLDDVPEEPLGWLIATARRVLANQRRSQERQAALRTRLHLERGPAEIDQAETIASAQAWSEALRSLAPLDQEVLTLIAWDGLSNREAADSLECSHTVFAMRLSRARRRLRTALADVRDQPDSGITDLRNFPIAKGTAS